MMHSRDGDAGGSGRSGSPGSPLPGPKVLLRVLLVDDHLLARHTTRRQLDEIPNLQVVGEAADGFEALALARTLSPDLVFMDISMPGLDGIEATRRIRAEAPGVRVIILSSHEEAAYIWEALQAGAAGYLIKGQTVKDFANAIQKAFT
jgi:DNA-binding NarL/FixJ family response regulator